MGGSRGRAHCHTRSVPAPHRGAASVLRGDTQDRGSVAITLTLHTDLSVQNDFYTSWYTFYTTAYLNIDQKIGSGLGIVRYEYWMDRIGLVDRDIPSRKWIFYNRCISEWSLTEIVGKQVVVINVTYFEADEPSGVFCWLKVNYHLFQVLGGVIKLKTYPKVWCHKIQLHVEGH